MSRFSERWKEIEWGPPQWQPKQKKEAPSGAFLFVPDIKEFVSPIDYSVVSSRSALREHERKHQVRQVGELKDAKDFSNDQRRTESFNERRFEQAYRTAVQKTGL